MNIQIRSLTKSYTKKQKALDQISLDILTGMFGLLGPNGAGKSTLMKILVTMLPPTSGEVRYNDWVLGRDDHRIRQIIGYLPQSFGLYDQLTGEEFLHHVATIKGLKGYEERKKQVDTILEKVNLLGKRKDRIKTYSGGMKQRIGLAQALLADPQVIIVDEPTAGLDPEERVRLRQFLGDLSESKTIILSTHIVSDIENSCTQLAIMKQGKLLYHGDPDELLATYNGKVWSGAVEKESTLRNMKDIVLINKRRLKDQVAVRLVAEEQPFDGASQSEPNLEDVYMAMMGDK